MDIPEIDSLKLARLPKEIAEDYFQDYHEAEWLGHFVEWVDGAPLIYKAWRFFKNKFPELANSFDFKSYHEGFINGFFDYKDKPFLNDEDKKNELYYGASNLRGITVSYSVKYGYFVSKKNAYFSGQCAGRFYYCWYQIIEHPEAFIEKFKKRKEQRQIAKSQNKKVNKELLGLFCQMLNKSRIHEKNEWDSESKYCEEVCKNYDLPYSDKVRQNFKTEEYLKFREDLLKLCKKFLSDEECSIVEDSLKKEIANMR